MRKLLTLFVLIAAAAFGADVAGKWKGSIDLKLPNGEGRTIPVLLNLTKTDAGYKGSIGGGEQDQHEIKTVKLEGNRMNLLVEFEDKVVNLTLIADEDTLKGDIEFTESQGKGTGTASMKRVPSA